MRRRWWREGPEDPSVWWLVLAAALVLSVVPLTWWLT